MVMLPVKTDIRIYKTKKAIFFAFEELLKQQKFSKINVQDICKESVVSRTAFYTHFKDKFDLLEQWLAVQKCSIMQILMGNNDSQAENIIYEKLQNNFNVLINLLDGADREQQKLLLRFFAPETKNTLQGYNKIHADFDKETELSLYKTIHEWMDFDVQIELNWDKLYSKDKNTPVLISTFMPMLDKMLEYRKDKELLDMAEQWSAELRYQQDKIRNAMKNFQR